jgi:hypothetical protein
MSVHEMHDPYGRRYPVIEWHLNVRQLPEWAAPRVREEPRGRPVERMMILAPVVEDSDKELAFGSLARYGGSDGCK